MEVRIVVVCSPVNILSQTTRAQPLANEILHQVRPRAELLCICACRPGESLHNVVALVKRMFGTSVPLPQFYADGLRWFGSLAEGRGAALLIRCLLLC